MRKKGGGREGRRMTRRMSLIKDPISMEMTFLVARGVKRRDWRD